MSENHVLQRFDVLDKLNAGLRARQQLRQFGLAALKRLGPQVLPLSGSTEFRIVCMAV
jgi:hypothetical protein